MGTLLILLIPITLGAAIGGAICALVLKWSVEAVTKEAPEFSTCFWVSFATAIVNFVCSVLPGPQLFYALVILAFWVTAIKTVFGLSPKETALVVAANLAIVVVLYIALFMMAAAVSTNP